MSSPELNSENVVLTIGLLGWIGFIGLIIYIYLKKSAKRYLIPLRLEDVIRLITALALDSADFKTEASVVEALRGEPLSANSWHEIAKQHPEFFRPNFGSTHVALLMRSYIGVEPNKPRRPLEIIDTQKLIDVAITLHEKEVQQSQKYSIWFPLIAAVLGALAVIIVGFFHSPHA